METGMPGTGGLVAGLITFVFFCFMTWIVTYFATRDSNIGRMLVMNANLDRSFLNELFHEHLVYEVAVLNEHMGIIMISGVDGGRPRILEFPDGIPEIFKSDYVIYEKGGSWYPVPEPT